MSTKGSHQTTGKHGLPVLAGAPYADLFPGISPEQADGASVWDHTFPAKSQGRCPKCGAKGCFNRKTEEGALYRCGQCRRETWNETVEAL